MHRIKTQTMHEIRKEIKKYQIDAVDLNRNGMKILKRIVNRYNFEASCLDVFSDMRYFSYCYNGNRFSVYPYDRDLEMMEVVDFILEFGDNEDYTEYLDLLENNKLFKNKYIRKDDRIKETRIKTKRSIRAL